MPGTILGLGSHDERTAMFYILIFAGLAVLIIVTAIVQRSRRR